MAETQVEYEPTSAEKDWPRYFFLQVEFHPVNAATDAHKPVCMADLNNEEWVGWQYACAAVVAPEAYDRIRVPMMTIS